MKNVFVILGMARSGTSVITRGLKALGVDLGNKLTPATKWNPKGFWEDNEIVYKINERALSLLSRSWDSISLIEDSSQEDEKLENLKIEAANLLNNRFETTDFWAFKDPRTSKLLPFWQSVFKTMSLNEHYIIAFRNPLASAQSFQRLTGTDIEHGLLLWLTHNLAVLDKTQNKQRIFVNYDSVMQAPRFQLERIQKQLAIPNIGNTAEIDAYVNGFLDKNLQHYEFNLHELCSHPAVSSAPLSVELYKWLIKIARDDIDSRDALFLAALENIKLNFNQFSPIYNYVDKLLKRSQTLQKSIYALHKTRLWKMIYPLRKMDELLRARRKRKKQNN